MTIRTRRFRATVLRAALALLLALASAKAVAQSDDDLPLAGLNAPEPEKKPAKPAKGSKGGKTKPHAAPRAGDTSATDQDTGAMIAAPPSSAPPAPLPDVPGLNLSTRIGVIFLRSPLVDEASAYDLESGLRGIAFQAPLSQNPLVLWSAPGKACGIDDDGCLFARAMKEGLDSVLVAAVGKSAGGLSIRVRHLIVVGRKRAASEGEAPASRLALKAQAEALACKLLVPNGCSNEVLIDVGSADLLYDGRLLPRGNQIPMRAMFPVGLAPLSARENGVTGPMRLVPVLREKMPGIAMTVRTGRDGVPKLLTPDELEEVPAQAPAVAVVETSTSSARWQRPVGYAIAGAGALVLVAGLIEGAHSKSLLNQASTSFNAHGGAYAQSDLPTLSSGNSAARTANLLLLAGGIAAAAGLTLALAF